MSAHNGPPSQRREREEKRREEKRREEKRREEKRSQEMMGTEDTIILFPHTVSPFKPMLS